MVDYGLLKKVIARKEWNTVFYLLDQLYSEYVEGDWEYSNTK